MENDTKESVRPDFYKDGFSVDVKNNQGVNPIPWVSPGDAIWPYDFEDSSVLEEVDIT